MSQDEIHFGEVKYREPERRRRPDRDRRWACVAYEVPGPTDLPIFLDRQTADAIERHALRDTSVELGGILLGKECVDDETDEPYVLITRALEAKHYENTQASFTYTHDSWEEITRERDRLHPDLDIVGWYHTHPDFGIFLSNHDLFIHKNFFDQPLQVAYVVDPIRQTRGFFQWRDGRLDQVGGFSLFADRHDRSALARLVNDLENIPNSEGGGGLSPRLEAELIAMITRPPMTHVSATDRTQSALLFGMLGMMAGVLIFAAGYWLNSLGNQFVEQAKAFREMETTVKQTGAMSRLTAERLLSKAADGKPETLLEEYEKAARAVDDARARLDDQKAINESLARQLKVTKEEAVALKTDLEKTKKEAAASEKDANEADRLRARVSRLEARNEFLEPKEKELERLLHTTEGSEAATLTRKYERTWWVAVIACGASVLLTLGLIATFANAEPQPPMESPEPTPASPPHVEPPHQIT